MTDRVTTLRLVGEAVYGDTHWQRALARDLGPLHPGGERTSLDERLMRRWLAREREVPDWVGKALAQICRDRQQVVTEATEALASW